MNVETEKQRKPKETQKLVHLYLQNSEIYNFSLMRCVELLRVISNRWNTGPLGYYAVFEVNISHCQGLQSSVSLRLCCSSI